MAETEILARLILAATGMHGADPSAVDAVVIDTTLGKSVTEAHSPVHGRDPKELAKQLDRSGQIVTLAGDIIRSKALDILVERADITEETPQAEDTDASAPDEPAEQEKEQA